MSGERKLEDSSVAELTAFDPEISRRVLDHPVVQQSIKNRETIAAWRMATIWLAIFCFTVIPLTFLIGYLNTEAAKDIAHQNALSACQRGQLNGKKINDALAKADSPIRIDVVKDCNEVVR